MIRAGHSGLHLPKINAGHCFEHISMCCLFAWIISQKFEPDWARPEVYNSLVRLWIIMGINTSKLYPTLVTDSTQNKIIIPCFCPSLICAMLVWVYVVHTWSRSLCSILLITIDHVQNIIIWEYRPSLRHPELFTDTSGPPEWWFKIWMMSLAVFEPYHNSQWERHPGATGGAAKQQ